PAPGLARRAAAPPRTVCMVGAVRPVRPDPLPARAAWTALARRAAAPSRTACGPAGPAVLCPRRGLFAWRGRYAPPQTFTPGPKENFPEPVDNTPALCYTK